MQGLNSTKTAIEQTFISFWQGIDSHIGFKPTSFYNHYTQKKPRKFGDTPE
jgi:hypothetical protein